MMLSDRAEVPSYLPKGKKETFPRRIFKIDVEAGSQIE